MAAHWASIGTGGAGFTRESGIEKYEDRESLSARLQRFHSTSSDQLFPKYREPWLQHPTTDHVKEETTLDTKAQFMLYNR